MHTNTKVNKWSQIEPPPVYVIGLLIALLTFTQSVLAETRVFGPGVYDLTTPVVIDTDNTYIELQPGAVLRGVDPIITIKGPVTNIGVYGRGTLEGGVNAYGGATNLSLEDFTVTSAKNAIRIDGRIGGCQDLRITGLNIYDVDEGILFRNCQDFIIHDNTIRDLFLQDGIEPVNSQRGIISNNRITNPGTGNSAIDLFVNYTTTPGELAEISSIMISNNILTRTTPGFLASGINLHGNIVGANLQGNQIVGTFRHGIRLIGECRDISITNHLIRDVNIGIAITGENVRVTDSQFIDIATWSIVTGSKVKGPVIIRGNLFSGDAHHFLGGADATIDANIFMGTGWAIGNGINPIIHAINNDFRGPNSISSPNKSNLFTRDNIGE